MKHIYILLNHWIFFMYTCNTFNIIMRIIFSSNIIFMCMQTITHMWVAYTHMVIVMRIWEGEKNNVFPKKILLRWHSHHFIFKSFNLRANYRKNHSSHTFKFRFLFYSKFIHKKSSATKDIKICEDDDDDDASFCLFFGPS